MELITQPDGFEVVRDQIAAILVLERDDQMSQAQAQSLDPELWNFKVFTERSNPWGDYLNDSADLTPIINVWFDSDSFADSASVRSAYQKCNGFFNVDITAAGKRSTNMTGDETAARNAARVARLARNILMASNYTYLGLPRGTAWDRKVESRQAYQPPIGSDAALRVNGVRLRVQVSFNETAPQYEGVPLAGVDIEIKRKETGEVYIDLAYDY